jgi:hypothetical protein
MGAKKRALSAQSPRTKPDIPSFFEKGYQGVLSPVGQCIRSEIERKKDVVHVLQGDERNPESLM